MRTHLMMLTAACFVPLCFGQTPGPARGPARAGRPALFFREEWKPATGGAEAPVNPAEAVANPSLELKLYGPGGKDIQLTGVAQSDGNPLHLWTGLCEGVCAAALRDKSSYVDLTGLAMIRWVTKVSGFHQIHPILKLADGTWLVGDHADGSTVDWHQNEFSIADVRWRKLNIAKVVTTGDWVNNPDLSKVDEVGFHGPSARQRTRSRRMVRRRQHRSLRQAGQTVTRSPCRISDWK
jgi:hypothetical protein